MSILSKLEQIKVWCTIHASGTTHWYRPWHRGYIQSCRDILLLLEDEGVAILPLREYKAIEGYYKEIYGQ